LKEGGLAKVPDKWQGLEQEAVILQGNAANIRQLDEDLLDKAHDTPKLVEVARALYASARQIEEDTAPLDGLYAKMAPSHAERRLDHLPQIRELHLLQAASRGEQGAAGSDDTPSQVVRNAFTEVIMRGDLSSTAEDAYGKWAANSASFLDRYAEFALASEKLSQLSRLPGDRLSEDDKQALKAFAADRKKPELDTYAKSTGELRTAMAGSNNSINLTRPARDHNRADEEQHCEWPFHRCQRDNPMPTAEDQVSPLSTKRRRALQAAPRSLRRVRTRASSARSSGPGMRLTRKPRHGAASPIHSSLRSGRSSASISTPTAFKLRAISWAPGSRPSTTCTPSGRRPIRRSRHARVSRPAR